VLAAVVAATLLIYFWGPPLPYRAGEVSPVDLRVRAYFELENQPQTQRAREEAVERLPAELQQDAEACERARRAVPPVIEKFPPGTPLVQRGQPISSHQLTLLGEEDRAYHRALGQGDHFRRGVSIFLIMSLLAVLVALYVVRFQPALAQGLPPIVGICGLVVLTLALGLLLSQPPWYAVLVPLTMTALILTLAYNAPFALLMSLTMSFAMTVAMGTDLNHLLVQMGGLATAVLSLRNVRTRTRLVEVGAGAGLAFLAMTVATGLLQGQTASLIFFDAGRHFLWGALAGFLVSGCLPLVERGFGIVTDISLLELADGSHPLMQELIRRAPGTYTHSMTVATLAEAAAEAIDANPLLTRVGSYFHDIGKMLKPHYFIENQTGENRHDALEPALSTLIIINHVKDGVALAEQYRLPQPIIDFIEQHHGTTLVEYFYHAAKEQAEGEERVAEVEFRYPGPKPRTREAAIVMLADAVESATRALVEPNPSRIEAIVRQLSRKRLTDGQFDQCPLTFRDLGLIEEAMIGRLCAIHHGRISYPRPGGEGEEATDTVRSVPA
jgi:hypothetical protein